MNIGRHCRFRCLQRPHLIIHTDRILPVRGDHIDGASAVIERLTARNEWKFAGVLVRADRGLAIAWWALIVLRGLLPAVFAIAMGWLVATIQNGGNQVAPLALVWVVFVRYNRPPIHRAAGRQSRQPDSGLALRPACINACIRPPGMGHLEKSRAHERLWMMARDFDLAISGPPLFVSMDFIAHGLVEMLAGVAAAMVLAGFSGERPSRPRGGVARDALAVAGEPRSAATATPTWFARPCCHADYAYRLAVDPPAAKELRLFGLAGWVVERFRVRRLQLDDLRWQATRLRERPVVWSLLIVLIANVIVFWSLGADAADGGLTLGRLVTYATAAVTTSMIAIGGLSWGVDYVALPGGRAVLRVCKGRWQSGVPCGKACNRQRRCLLAKSVFAMSRSLVLRQASRCSPTSTW